jgi:hypothetical protein
VVEGEARRELLVKMHRGFKWYGNWGVEGDTKDKSSNA